ncbi:MULTISPECIES: OmpA family protein [unclassified Imperialibacter]|uniref:OmpA family protein n=1 Tax=unclassified Imperialibacter TaxID=2629706 RepID=UPI00186A7A22|nr:MULTISPECIES: OmpA family protein [unclassified Imperialibacter]
MNYVTLFQERETLHGGVWSKFTVSFETLFEVFLGYSGLFVVKVISISSFYAATMNINVFLGVVSFAVWSTLSTWLYVNYIKVFDTDSQKELVMLPKKAAEVTSMAAEDKSAAEVPMPIELTKTFTFHINTADMIHPGAVKQFADSLQPLLAGRKVDVSIMGYTCDLGTEAYNMKLGLSRANYVMTALKASTIDWPALTFTSQGEANPLVPNTSELNRIKNRRVTLLISSKP